MNFPRLWNEIQLLNFKEIIEKMQLTILLMMASGALGQVLGLPNRPNRLSPFLPIHDLFSAAQISKLNSIVDRK